MNTLLAPKNKKGTHTGMILSFVVFITSLVVIYMVVDIPSNDSLEKKYSIDILKANLLKEVSHDMIITRVNDPTPLANCSNFSNPTGYSLGMGAIAINSLSQEIPLRVLDGLTYIENGNSLTKIYYINNAGFNNTLPSSSIINCVPIATDNTVYKNLPFESSITDIINDTINDYDNLKLKLGVPLDDEFTIQFTYPNLTSIGNYEVNDIKTNVYVSEYKLNYISLKGEEKTGVVNIGLW